MDNFHIDVTSEGKAALATALSLAFGRYRSTVGYAIREAEPGARHDPPEGFKYPHLMEWNRKPKPRRLVFYWSDSEKREDFVPLPFKLDAAGAADFAERWLAELDYGKQPDHDGDNGKGWRCYCEGWGHVDGQWSAFVAIAPAWAMYGK